jgi:hypothetical protein
MIIPPFQDLPGLFKITTSQMTFNSLTCYFKSAFAISPKKFLDLTRKAAILSKRKIKLTSPFSTMID